MFAPLSKYDPEITFEEGVEIICKGMAPLGDEYVQPMRKGLVNRRWVDVYPNQGKRRGAYSSGTYGTNPFILMSYSDKLTSVSTLAHELGHSMHSYLTRRNQPPIYSHTRCSWPRWPPTSTRRWCATICSRAIRDPQFPARRDRRGHVQLPPLLLYHAHPGALRAGDTQRVERGEALTAET